ncbi:YIP1 family protein [Loigolactobacillus coryniformis]|uniref:YIP1 family protein n=1 Tax=Loigolactobacillus coryniformis TaxID=1610 RepID=UPI00356B6EF8
MYTLSIRSIIASTIQKRVAQTSLATSQTSLVNISTVFVMLSTILGFLVYSLIIYMIMRFLKQSLSFKESFSIYAFSQLPIVGSLLIITFLNFFIRAEPQNYLFLHLTGVYTLLNPFKIVSFLILIFLLYKNSELNKYEYSVTILLLLILTVIQNIK